MVTVIHQGWARDFQRHLELYPESVADLWIHIWLEEESIRRGNTTLPEDPSPRHHFVPTPAGIPPVYLFYVWEQRAVVILEYVTYQERQWHQINRKPR
jgi:hypothetical protein